jgi:hypothetical protein
MRIRVSIGLYRPIPIQAVMKYATSRVHVLAELKINMMEQQVVPNNLEAEEHYDDEVI